MSLQDLAISLGGSVLLLILFLCVVAALTFFFYRTTTPPIRQRKKLLLASLRAFALALLLMLAFEPLVRFTFQEEQEPVLAVLIDTSESMSVGDKGAARATTIREFLAGNLLTSLPSKISYYRFSSGLDTAEALLPDSVKFTGETTDLAAALERLEDFRSHENIQAALLISDGVYTVGRNPLAVVEKLGMPVYTLGVGDTVDQRDILIAKVTTNKIVYASTRVPVDVRVRSSGFSREKVEVTLAHGSTVLDRKIVQLQEGRHDYPVSLSYEPGEEGTQRYTAAVSPLPGELTTRNNFQSFFVKVLKTKLHVLLLAGAPSPDVSTVKQTLSEIEHFSLQSLIQKRTGEFYEAPPSQRTLDTADCLVVVGFPSAASSLTDLQLLSNALEKSRKPVLFIASKTLDFEKLRTFEPFLPFSSSAPGMRELLVFPEVAEKQRTNALVQLNGNVTAEGWQKLPPIFKTQTVFRAKPESDVLAFAKVQSVVLNEPLVSTRNVARHKSFAIAGHGIWRWRLLAQGNPQTEKFLSLLLTNAVRWLTTIDEGKKVRVQPTKESFTTAESVEFTGEVYDKQLRPVDNSELRVSISTGEQKTETILRSTGSGRYEGEIEGLGAGEYTFSARATRNGNILGEDRGKFSVGQMNVEFLESKMNKELLEQIAFRTGGLYTDIANAGSLVDSVRTRVKFTPNILVHKSEIELWNWQYLTALIVALLGTEWFIRKRSGML